ncbi:MAG: DUF805 domain-containing protein [Rhizobiaceae bacterium]|nr:DUF805 domain-containing protein [Rhizobiaceae bacterium]
MSFFKAISEGFANYFNFNGTASRTQFWFWLLFVTIALCFALIIDGLYLGPMWSTWQGAEDVLPFDQDAGQPLSIFLLALFAVPTITISGRRLHDSGYSARWLLLALTVIGILPLLYFFFKKGLKSGTPNPYSG